MKPLALAILALLLLTAAGAKQGRTFYTEAKLQAASERIAKYEWARASVGGAEAVAAKWVAMSDQELWDFVPPPEQLRALNVSFGVDCPVHGAEIFRKGGHYPWTMSDDRPFKVKCPVGGEEYPSNDFKPWNTNSLKEAPQTGSDCVDLGSGWTNAEGRRFFFVGYYVFWHRWQKQVLPAVSQLAQAYLLSGKLVYAHKCAVLMSRIAADYERFDYPTQAYHNGSWPAHINGRILDYIWTTGTTTSFATAYDAIYPALEEPDLLAFLKTKQVEQPRRHIEQKMLNPMATDIMRGFIKGNEGMHQQALATVAIVLDNSDPAQGPTTKQMTDWIMTGPGNAEFLLWNGFYRDGHGGESSPGYSSGWVSHFYEIAKLLPLLGVDIWANPKLKAMAEIGLDMTMAGRWSPAIGDHGSIGGAGPVATSPNIQGPAFAHYKDARFAQALKQMNATGEGLFETQFDPQEVEAAVAKAGPDLTYKTRNLGGYGLAILESGEGQTRRAASMYYGHSGGGHGHKDRLTIEMHDSRFKTPVLNDMGYPAHWLDKCTYWTTNTVSHYAVLVNEGAQQTMYAGHLNTLAAAPGLQLMDASADKVAYPSAASVYRRTVALVDLDPQSSYLLDIYRVKGGWQHDYSFHGPALPEFSVSGGTPGPVQDKGTLAGVDVPFGGKPQAAANAAGQAIPLRLAEGVLRDDRAYDVRSNDGWAAYGDMVLTRKVGSALTLKSKVAPGKYRVFLRVYDYNAGDNAVEVAVGGAKVTIPWSPSGEVGERWTSELIEVPATSEQIVITATRHGQSYVLVDSLALTTDLDATEPRVWDSTSSGFQYLYNIRRMAPERDWSATWADPTAGQGLKLTVPQGCAGEVILADAEPELQPGAPKSLQYLLARKAAAANEKELASTYIAVAEPYQGSPQVTAVNRLKSEAAQWGTVGLEVLTATGRDLIHSSLNPGERVQWQAGDQTLTVAAEFAAVKMDARGVRAATVVNGTELLCGDFRLKVQPSPTGKVLAVDHQANTITIEGELKTPGALVDCVIILGNEQHQTSYTVRSVKITPGQSTLHFGSTLPLVGMGVVTSVDGAQGLLNTDTRLTGYGIVDGGQHAGRWLYNEGKTRCLRIERFTGKDFRLKDAPADLEAVFADADGDGLRRFWISDIGPGDTYRLPAITHVSRTAAGTYEVRMMTDVELSVPRQ